MNEADETLQIFFAETDDLLRSAEESLLRLENNPGSGGEVQEIFRAIHTMKSGSAMVGFTKVSEYSHLLENLLERVRGGQLTVTKPLVSFLLEDIDFLRKMVERGGRGEPEAEPEVLHARKSQLNRFLGMDAISESEQESRSESQSKPQSAPAPQPASKAPKAAKEKTAKAPAADGRRYYEIELKFRKDLFSWGQDPILLLLGLEEVADIVDVTADMSRLPDYESFDPYNLYISWRLTAKTKASLEEMEDVFMFVRDDNEISIEDITARYKEGVDIAVGERPLGEVLLERGAITKGDLDVALGKQKRLGEILVEEGKIDSSMLEQVVGQQEESRQTYRKTSVRVDVEKINHLVNLAEEIGIGLSRLQNFFGSVPELSGGEADQELENLLKVNREFQERVAQVRMFPLEGTFRRFQRIARDTAFEQGKRVRVSLIGVDTELDKEVIEHITDPLKHLVRNCVDHGIETPEEREAAGKPPEGVIEFRAFQKGGMILVRISDDGRGLDLDRIAEQAVEREIILPGETVDNSNVLDIICQPGFSTASAITALSGRGVGMDVVRNEVEQLGGTMQIETEKGKGTTFTLSLPLTFALLEALHIKDQDRSYLIPLWGVVGTQEYDPAHVKFFGAGERLYTFRGEYVPVVHLSKVYGIDCGEDRVGGGSILVFIDTSRQRFGLLVDKVLDPHQVVVKSLESNFKSVAGISGATIMGDGSVALVMDLFALEEMFFNRSSARSDA
ncbi:two-component system, chemotaxis family, sensor kinase CheA [Desulfatibacillum alkenivorans DSM 16219]|jgi:two-component system chemotaxis sensor kinase CheA|uniref:Chemotaxis protein CheA n=1 Tax=Desulfatibacillum alkenivorans DSM 16219 TaxID=1121393 RepID=A0A1M6RI29_9BACT|nr:chemotaxis protein CheA [Desulfatibacillum alkenivorans]SHK32171.1 two-component system, chemotaxis family, sensor kinase CheA [Desulfatibacillum alkenivorans DSM 16219]